MDLSSFICQPLPQSELEKRQKHPVKKGGQIAFVQLDRSWRFKPDPKGYTAQEVFYKIIIQLVAEHNQEDDAWTVYNGKVYDITLYMDYHPGGKEKLMLAAGKDCTPLFNQFHQWINCHAFLEKDYLGPLVRKK